MVQLDFEIVRLVVDAASANNQQPGCCAGVQLRRVSVREGLVVGDEDGLVAFSQADAAEVLRRAAQHADHEEAVKAEIASGAVRQSWIDKVLDNAGLAS